MKKGSILALLVLCVSLIHAQSSSDALNLTFTTIDVPGAVATDVYGINTAGEIVGGYTDGSTDHGFLYSNGSFTFFDYPGQYKTFPFGINDSGLIAGTAYSNDQVSSVGFLYNGTTFSTIRVGTYVDTTVDGINNASTVVGGYGNFGGNDGYEMQGTKFKKVTPPNAHTLAYALGINNFGQIVGTEDNCGFLYNRGRFKTIDYPSALMTQPWGINDGGIVVGWYEGCSPCAFHGFAYLRGKYMTFDYPGSSATFGSGINASGQIVGIYTLDNITHGFVTTPISAADFQ